MLESIADVDRLASSAICVDHFATREVIEVPRNGRVSEVRAWMEVNDFDVAPLQGQQKPMVVLRFDLADGGEERPVQVLARSVSQEQLVSSSAALPSALQVLQSYGWFFVYDDHKITGIVTRSDLARPAISIYIFARMISLEHGLSV